MIEEIFKKIAEAKKILIITHVNPDGDTLGSACALKSFIGAKADILLQVSKGKNFPEIYSFMPYLKEAKTLDNVEPVYDTVICADVASIERIVEKGKKAYDAAQIKINIDHHKTNRGFADLNYVKGGLSSTGEVLYDMFKDRGINVSLEMANCLYVSILTDTGAFKYETVTPRTLLIASKLSELGVDTSNIARLCYDLRPKAMVMFQAYCVSKAQFMCNDKIAYTKVLKCDMEKFNAKDEHTEGICENLRSIKPVEFAIVIKETDNGSSKVSLRSKEKDVTKIVEKFGGGGHSRAAGCTIRKPINQALDILLEEVKKYV